MTPKEKAKELVDKIYQIFEDDEDEHFIDTSKRISKQSALIAVNQMISMLLFTDLNTYIGKWCEQQRNYLNEVKQELEKL